MSTYDTKNQVISTSSPIYNLGSQSGRWRTRGTRGAACSAVTSRRAGGNTGRLPASVLDEVLHAVDRSWLPGIAGLAQAAEWISSSETKDGTPLGFKQMLYLYVGADTNLPAIEAKLIKPSEAAGRAVLRQRAAVVEGAAAHSAVDLVQVLIHVLTPLAAHRIKRPSRGRVRAWRTPPCTSGRFPSALRPPPSAR